MTKKSGFILGTIIGGTTAAFTALLLAPKSGKELREHLLTQKISDSIIQKLGKQSLDLTNRFKKTEVNSKEDTDEISDISSKNIEDIFIDIKDTIGDPKDNVKESMEEESKETVYETIKL